MLTFTLTIISLLAALLLVQALLAAGFAARLRRPDPAPYIHDHRPRTALILCVRGKDPTLIECLNAALNQDYPDYRVHVVVDSEDDPAFPLVKGLIEANPHTPSTVQILKNPLSTCSLKCSSLIQAITGLDADVEAVVLLDTDVIPHRAWLGDMVAPLANSKVGAATGNRWLARGSRGTASLARHAWNAAAVVMMYWLGIPWAGSLAIERRVIDEGRLLSRWRRAYGDDTALDSALRALDLRLELVPAAFMPERGAEGIGAFADWAVRQLVSCRLHHRGWPGVLLHGVAVTLILGLVLAGIAAAIASHRFDLAAALAGALATYYAGMAGLLSWLDANVARAAPPERSEERKPGLSLAIRLAPALLLAQIIHAFALLKAATAKHIDWRGIRYRIEGKGAIRITAHALPEESAEPRPSHRPAGVAGA